MLISKTRKGYLRIFSKKLSYISVWVAAIFVFFLVYNSSLADRSIVNLHIILDKIAVMKSTKDLIAVEPFLDEVICTELSKRESDPLTLEILQFLKYIISQPKSRDQIKDLKFFLTELNKYKKNKRNFIMYNLDAISSLIEPLSKSMRVFALNERANMLSQKIISLNNPEELQKLYFALGSIKMSLNELTQAQAYFVKTWEVKPDNLWAIRGRFKYAAINEMQKKFNSAKSVLGSLVQAYPGTQTELDSRYRIAGIYQQSGEFDKAIEAFESLALAYPGTPVSSLVWFKVGYSYVYDLKDYQKFMQILNDKIKEEKPKSVWAKYLESEITQRVANKYCNLGFMLILKRRYQEALDCFSFALKIDPDLGSCYTGQGLSYFWLGQKDKALDMAKKGRRISPQDSLTVVNLGFIYINLGMLDDAIAEYKNFLSAKPSCKEAHYNLGYIYTIIGENDNAINEFRKVVVIDNKFSIAHSNIGYLLWYSEKYAQAIEEFKKAIHIDPSCMEAHFNLGFAFKVLGRLSESKAEFEDVLKIDPAQTEAAQNIKEIDQTLSSQ